MLRALSGCSHCGRLSTRCSQLELQPNQTFIYLFALIEVSCMERKNIINPQGFVKDKVKEQIGADTCS